MITAVPVDTTADEAHSAYFRQFPFGNELYYVADIYT